MTVLRARGVQSEAHIPFAGLLELLRPALDAIGRLPEPQASALAGALALRPARAYDRFAVGAATLTLLAAVAESRPLLVLVDDVHWLDGSSADALRFAFRRLVADPIAVVLTMRAGEPSPLDDAGFATMSISGLSLDAAAELLRREAPETTAVAAARLHRETGGNPLALLELVGSEAEDIPLATPVAALTSVASVYLRRTRGLPERTRAALVVAAASDAADVSVLERALGTGGLGVSDLFGAEEAGLVAFASGRVEFRHPLTRSAIYGDAAPEQRRAAHRALAEALGDADADRRTWHLALGTVGVDDGVSSELEAAGQRARDRSAYDVASRAFERAARFAADERRRARLLYAAADVSWLGGLADRTLGLLDEVARHTSDEELLVDAEHLRGHIALRRGPVNAGRAILLAAAERAVARAPEAAVVMLAEAAEGAFFAGDADAMRACGERASALAQSVGGRAMFFASMTAGMGRLLAGEREGANLIRGAVALLGSTDDFDSDPRLLAWAAFAPLWLRETGPKGGFVERAVATARTSSAVGALPHLLTHIGIDEAATGRFAEAQATFDEAIRFARETGQRTILAGALAYLARVEGRCGREHACREHAEEAIAVARELGAHVFEIWGMAALGELDFVLGYAESALAHFDEQQAALDRYRITDADLVPSAERAELYLRLGRRDDAQAVAESFARTARAKGQPWALARAARASGVVGDDDFEPSFEEARALHELTPDRFETARTELAFGSRLRRAGQRARAREHLRAAFDGFDELGAMPWAELARVELAATGESARRRDPSTLDNLTPQELNVALMLAGGKTTREAAAALFLSPKTIEYHLRNAYRKLGVHSRHDLADVIAARHGSMEAL